MDDWKTDVTFGGIVLAVGVAGYFVWQKYKSNQSASAQASYQASLLAQEEYVAPASTVTTNELTASSYTGSTQTNANTVQSTAILTPLSGVTISSLAPQPVIQITDPISLGEGSTVTVPSYTPVSNTAFSNILSATLQSAANNAPVAPSTSAQTQPILKQVYNNGALIL